MNTNISAYIYTNTNISTSTYIYTNTNISTSTYPDLGCTAVLFYYYRRLCFGRAPAMDTYSAPDTDETAVSCSL